MNKHPGCPCRRLAALLAASCFLLTGCDIFRGWDFMDYQAPPERLQMIETLNLEAMSAPETGPSSGEPTSREATTQPAADAPAKELKLTLEECRALALEGNLDLKVQLLNPTIAAQSITEAEAQFESLFFATAAYSKTDAPAGIGSSGFKSDSFEVTPGVRVPLRTGGTVEASLEANRYKTNVAGSALNPSYAADLGLSITQPLLRDAGLRHNTHAIRIARWERQKSSALAKLEVIRVLSAVDRVYWRLYAARQELEVRKQEHALAEAQLNRARRQVAAGTKPEVEILRAQLGVAERLEAIIVAENALRRRQRELKRVLQKPGLGMETPTVLLPATPPSVARYKLDAGRLVGLGLANRMELLELELQIAQDTSTVNFERNRTLPLVTLGYTYSVNGLGDSPADAFDLLFEKRFEDHFLGLQVEVPLGNQAARSRLRRAVLTRIQRLATRELRRSLIDQEVRDSVDQLQANWQRILAGRERVVLAERVHQAEQRQFDLGLRTSTEVLEAQTRLADAQLAVIQALAEYQTAQVDLAVATGTMLGAARVRWEPIVPPAKPVDREAGPEAQP
jgi:outer membrane protein